MLFMSLTYRMHIMLCAYVRLVSNIGRFEVFLYFSNAKMQENVAGNDCPFRNSAALPFFKGITYIAYGQTYWPSHIPRWIVIGTFIVGKRYLTPSCMNKRESTIRDIAIKLDISVSTVSRALRNMPEVNEKTRKKVLAMAEQLSYEPNRVAQSLRIRRTNTIGVIVPEVEMHFFSSIISGIQETANRLGFNVMFCQSNESYETELANIQALISSRVDGLLISLSRETNNPDHINHLLKKNTPLVLFDRVFDDINTSKVIVDDYEGAFHAVSYIIKTGCINIAYLGGPSDMSISNYRLKGYLDALKQGKTSQAPLVIHCENLEDGAAKGAKKLLALDNPPDAIFCFNDPVAIKAMQVIKEKGLNIPDQVAVVGFTDDPVSSLITPSLTTVIQPSYEMGRTAAQLLITHITSKEDFEPETKVLKTKLVIRESTRKSKL